MLHLNDFDLEGLAMALENHFMDYETFFWMDPATGKIELWSEEVADEAETEGWDVDDRGGIRIDPMESYEGYRDMEEFISGVADPHSRDRLVRAIDRSKPFRHFRDALTQFPEIQDQWYIFHDGLMKRRAIEWIQENGLVTLTEAEAALALLRTETKHA
ncbi:hypothetical protein ART_3138 [Arthrobacter sp. PAMC 25486]|uniref:UPF0158 family protein n=1 Tax=Arthrobacter sp. PAMC 25486 TaxID=1494608 RepID=UPI000535D722|nr:UPF0158 family protein [Arthrobacter sp. PAMC 25486]AIY02737.1 hypothetical protein ART_3138 [Arthrobacter sp. PAMC 25486]